MKARSRHKLVYLLFKLKVLGGRAFGRWLNMSGRPSGVEYDSFHPEE